VSFIKEFLYYYKTLGPKHGWIMSIEFARFNALYFNRDGSWKINTRGEKNEVK
tara:strand:+ start:93 stop:251 length:159 start_codon:yes stop_codon:yes gene_type:complete